MHAVLVIPELAALAEFVDAERVLMRGIAGVPLLIRVIATGIRAGITELWIVWPPDVDRSVWDQCGSPPLLRGLQVVHLVRPFDPRQPASWAGLAEVVQEPFYWLPWNWVTTKRALAGLVTPLAAKPESWDAPALLERQAVVGSPTSRPREMEGVLVTSESRIAEAERFVVAHSGKPSDGIHSRFNRLLCRPAVRLLSHTAVTPNWITLSGLVIGIAAAVMYARGHYAAYVTGALLFFLSGLFDEADGMLARIEFRESAFGTWFEGVVDEVTYLLLFGGITAGLYRERGPGELPYGYLLLIGCTLSIAVTRWQRKLATAPGRPHEYAGRLNRLLEKDSFESRFPHRAPDTHLCQERGFDSLSADLHHFRGLAVAASVGRRGSESNVDAGSLFQPEVFQARKARRRRKERTNLLRERYESYHSRGRPRYANPSGSRRMSEMPHPSRSLGLDHSRSTDRRAALGERGGHRNRGGLRKGSNHPAREQELPYEAASLPVYPEPGIRGDQQHLLAVGGSHVVGGQFRRGSECGCRF